MPIPLSGLAALIAAAGFSGAAIIISVAEQPARMRLSPRAALDQWAPSYERGLVMQAGLAVTGAVLGGVAYRATGEPFFAYGAAALLTNVPYTIIFMLKTNKRLQSMQREKTEDETRSVELMSKWGKMHTMRGVFGLVATGLFGAAILALGKRI